MRIGYDHQIFAAQSHGGISRYFAELVGGLRKHPGIEPTIIAPLHINHYLQASGVRPSVRGLFLARARVRPVMKLSAALAPAFWLGGRFDIVHETYFSRSSRGRARVRVLTIYDTIHELFPEEFPDAKQVTSAKRAAIRRADHVICISATTREDAIRLLDVDPARSSVIHLANSLEAHNDGHAPNFAGRPFFLYVGHRGGYKNFATLLRGFAASPRLHQTYDLVVFGSRGFNPEEGDMIRSAGLVDRVRHVSGDDHALQSYYRRAAAFVYPSRYEGFGIPPLEAMANGCPVVCSNAGSISEVVGDAGAFFDPDDCDGLQTLLERVAADEQYAVALREKGFERVRSFSWDKCVAETLLTYERLLGRPPSVAAGHP